MVIRYFAPRFEFHLHLKMLYFNVKKLLLLLTTPTVFALFFVRYCLKHGKEPWDF